MPLMNEWVEIAVDEDLLVQVVRELLALATNPNHVEVVYGTAGRVILCEVHLADAWYQLRLSQQDDGTEVHASGFEVVATEDVDVADSANTTNKGTEELVPIPAIRGPGRPKKAPQPSASPKGEES